MLKILQISIWCLLIFGACTQNQITVLHGPQSLKGQVYGDSITDQNIKDVALLVDIMKDNTFQNLKIKGKVENVCATKGCWITMKLNNGELLRVTFKDYAFFVPKNITGKNVVIEGVVKLDSVSVTDQQHFAEDGGASKKEIERIAIVKQSLTFEAKGLVIL